MLFAIVYVHHTFIYNHNHNVLRVFFLFIFVFNNSFKFYNYCSLEVPILKVSLVSTLFFIYNLLVWSHYCNFIKEFNDLFYLSMPIDNGTLF